MCTHITVMFTTFTTESEFLEELSKLESSNLIQLCSSDPIHLLACSFEVWRKYYMCFTPSRTLQIALLKPGLLCSDLLRLAPAEKVPITITRHQRWVTMNTHKMSSWLHVFWPQISWCSFRAKRTAEFVSVVHWTRCVCNLVFKVRILVLKIQMNRKDNFRNASMLKDLFDSRVHSRPLRIEKHRRESHWRKPSWCNWAANSYRFLRTEAAPKWQSQARKFEKSCATTKPVYTRYNWIHDSHDIS